MTGLFPRFSALAACPTNSGSLVSGSKAAEVDPSYSIGAFTAEVRGIEAVLLARLQAGSPVIKGSHQGVAAELARFEVMLGRSMHLGCSEAVVGSCSGVEGVGPIRHFYRQDI